MRSTVAHITLFLCHVLCIAAILSVSATSAFVEPDLIQGDAIELSETLPVSHDDRPGPSTCEERDETGDPLMMTRILSEVVLLQQGETFLCSPLPHYSVQLTPPPEWIYC